MTPAVAHDGTHIITLLSNISLKHIDFVVDDGCGHTFIFYHPKKKKKLREKAPFSSLLTKNMPIYQSHNYCLNQS